MIRPPLWAKSSVKYARNVAAGLEPEDLRASTHATVEERREDLGQTSGRTVQISVGLAGRGRMDGRGKQVLIAGADSEFSELYGLDVQFVQGGLLVKHVPCNDRFARG